MVDTDDGEQPGRLISRRNKLKHHMADLNASFSNMTIEPISQNNEPVQTTDISEENRILADLEYERLQGEGTSSINGQFFTLMIT